MQGKGYEVKVAQSSIEDEAIGETRKHFGAKAGSTEKAATAAEAKDADKVETVVKAESAGKTEGAAKVENTGKAEDTVKVEGTAAKPAGAENAGKAADTVKTGEKKNPAEPAKATGAEEPKKRRKSFL